MYRASNRPTRRWRSFPMGSHCTIKRSVWRCSQVRQRRATHSKAYSWLFWAFVSCSSAIRANQRHVYLHSILLPIPKSVRRTSTSTSTLPASSTHENCAKGKIGSLFSRRILTNHVFARSSASSYCLGWTPVNDYSLDKLAPKSSILSVTIELIRSTLKKCRMWTITSLRKPNYMGHNIWCSTGNERYGPRYQLFRDVRTFLYGHLEICNAQMNKDSRACRFLVHIISPHEVFTARDDSSPVFPL